MFPKKEVSKLHFETYQYPNPKSKARGKGPTKK